ncbi:WD40 repeat-like protein, partial [Atractiella rhizophila]
MSPLVAGYNDSSDEESPLPSSSTSIPTSKSSSAALPPPSLDGVQGMDEEDEDVTVDGDVFGLSGIGDKSTATEAKKKAEGMEIDSAPTVLLTEGVQNSSQILLRPGDTEMNVNLAWEDLSKPIQGPKNPWSSRYMERQNILTGNIEPQAFNDADFMRQQRSFHVSGYAHNPSLLNSHVQPFIGDVHSAYSNGGQLSTDLAPSRSAVRATKRKRHAKGELGVFDEEGQEGESREYKGPWAGWEDERVGERVSRRRRSGRNRKREGRRHALIEDVRWALGRKRACFMSLTDYLGRTYMHIPQDVDVNLTPEEPGQQECYVPKSCIHTWSGHTKGVSAIRLFPGSGHLMLSASMDNRIKLWDVYHEGKCLRTFMGHSRAVKDVCFTNDGRKFMSASYDRQLKLWDTETGQCIQAFSNGKVPHCVKFNPDPDKQNIFLAGMADKKIVQFDINSGEITQEYDQHLGPVNTITFIDENRRFVSTSDDKTIRVWDFDIPVVIKYIAEPTMHSMPAVASHPSGKYLAFQSLDNQIFIYSTGESFRQNRKKAFRGHTVAGYACEIAFSPDGKFISSGDGHGNLVIWDWKNSKLLKKLPAHKKVLISHAWLPHETSKVVTASWDGNICLW